MRCSSLPNWPARGRKPVCPRIRKPLFCRGLRLGARWCTTAKWRIGDSNLWRFPVEAAWFQGRAVQKSGANETGLASVIRDWDSLPPDTRTAILAIVEAAQGR